MVKVLLYRTVSDFWKSTVFTNALRFGRFLFLVWEPRKLQHGLCDSDWAKILPEFYLKTQSVPRSKHTPSRLYKPDS